MIVVGGLVGFVGRRAVRDSRIALAAVGAALFVVLVSAFIATPIAVSIALAFGFLAAAVSHVVTTR